MAATSHVTYDPESLPGAVYRCEVDQGDRGGSVVRAGVPRRTRGRWLAVGAGPRSEHRRLARDLHEGAQQRLLSGVLRLSLVERRLRDDDDVLGLVREARAELDAGLTDLRELARGIHPAVLTDHGLSAAVRALTDRCVVPVELHDELAQRADPAVEAALYYTVAEALTNVVRYARASSATVSLYSADGCAVAEITDDGCGGADERRGTGLRGLTDRLGALRGKLELESPPDRGTTLRARVPLT